MTHIVNIAFQGGTHGNFLRFCIDKFSTLTPRLDGLPFNQNRTSHVELQYSGLVNNYHPTDTGFMHTDEPHILITIDQEDLLFVERWVTIRAGDFGVDTSEELVTLTPDFLKKFPWQEKFKKYYNLDLQKNYTVPRFILRDAYKMSFLDPTKSGFIVIDKTLRNRKPKNTFEFPVSRFWDKDKFFDTLAEASDFLKLQLDVTDKKIHDLFMNKLHFMKTKNRVEQVIKAIQEKQDMDIRSLDTVEQAYISAWIENNTRFVTVPLCNQFFASTSEITQWIDFYPQHYKAMNPNLPMFNNIPNPFHLWNIKK